MRKSGQKQGQFRTGERAGIWLAFALAIVLHAVILLLPVLRQSPPGQNLQQPIEIELTTVPAQPSATVIPKPIVETAAVKRVPEPASPALPKAPANPPEKHAAAEPASPLPEPPVAALAPRVLQRNLDNMSELEKSMLTSTILARQFLTEESAADRLFGRSLVQDSSEFQKEFHYPLRPDLLEMLDQPLPDVPFAYTPGLVYFAYDPGVKGDLQRFWDVITPEFGWRTRYGTEVRCALILVIVGCAWK